MHIASLVGTPVLSVWGATHPKAGFTGWGQTADRNVQLDLPCRPCSVYGNKPCQFGDFRCLSGITPEMIVEKGLRIINN
jgi:ADP-heptose:LPS heptosyltransferase